MPKITPEKQAWAQAHVGQAAEVRVVGLVADDVDWLADGRCRFTVVDDDGNQATFTSTPPLSEEELAAAAEAERRRMEEEHEAEAAAVAERQRQQRLEVFRAVAAATGQPVDEVIAAAEAAAEPAIVEVVDGVVHVMDDVVASDADDEDGLGFDRQRAEVGRGAGD